MAGMVLLFLLIMILGLFLLRRLARVRKILMALLLALLWADNQVLKIVMSSVYSVIRKVLQLLG